jgi:hypothetical protein
MQAIAFRSEAPRSHIGLDNVQFGQDIPESSTYAMLALGGAVFWSLAASKAKLLMDGAR